MIKEILDEMNLENGSNYKKTVVQKYQDNILFQRVISMALDSVRFTYGVTMRNVDPGPSTDDKNLEWALDLLETELVPRKTTGNAAITLLETIFEGLDNDNRVVLECILGRDLKVNFGKQSFNGFLSKEFKITAPPYTRCEIGTKKNVEKNIDFTKKVYSEIKMDGTFRRAINLDDVTFESRPGIESSFPLHEAIVSNLPKDYVYIGEMTLIDSLQRSKGNGLINSDSPPHQEIVYTIWDMIPITEYSMTKDEIKVAEKEGTMSLYEDRFNLLESEIAKLSDTDRVNVEIIEYKIITSMKEAYEHFQDVTKRGLEGTVIKAYDMTHKDGNSARQLKVKLEIRLDVICTGFTEGKKGTKREETFGAMTFKNEEGTIAGQCSGFTDELLEEINTNREQYIGKVFEIKCNDITLAKGKTEYALSHGNFQEWRSKTQTDTLKRAMELKEMAMELS